jgi:hypothetical protein
MWNHHKDIRYIRATEVARLRAEIEKLGKEKLIRAALERGDPASLCGLIEVLRPTPARLGGDQAQPYWWRPHRARLQDRRPAKRPVLSWGFSRPSPMLFLRCRSSVWNAGTCAPLS